MQIPWKNGPKCLIRDNKKTVAAKNKSVKVSVLRIKLRLSGRIDLWQQGLGESDLLEKSRLIKEIQRKQASASEYLSRGTMEWHAYAIIAKYLD